MAVHVDEIVSNVTTEPELATSAPSEPVKWEAQANVSAALSQAARDQYRTAAEGYDD